MIFSGVAAVLVYLAGRRDAARDPRLTGVALVLLAVFPLLASLVPKVAVLPVSSDGGAEVGFQWMGVVAGIWAVGFGVALLRLAVTAGILIGWRRRSVLIERAGRIEIRKLRGLKGPVAAGVFRPVVFVPESWSGWCDRTRKIVLDHETAHHHRRDPLWRWVAEIACAVNWYNPLVWWIVRRLTIQCEFACDTWVLRKGVPRADYAALLCDLAEDSVSKGPALAMAERSSLEVRVRRLMDSRKPQGMLAIPLLIALAIISASVLVLTGSKAIVSEPIPPDEVRTRWAADPFPGE